MKTRSLLGACALTLAAAVAAPVAPAGAVPVPVAGASASRALAAVTPAAAPASPVDPAVADLMRAVRAAASAGAPAASAVRLPVSARALPTARAQLRAAPALRLTVPRLGINRPMIRLHVQRNRSLSVPKSFADVGWWSEGPRPGGSGATIVGGHISSKAGPGAFYNLRRMRVRDLIYVPRADRTTAVYQVRSVRSFSRSNYPNTLVYRTTGRSSIHLITCDGVFNPRIGHHVNNLVVFADLVSIRRTAA